MQNRQVMRARKYLCRFDEILNQMAEKMLSKQMNNSITIHFIEDMIVHHQAGIDMAENLLNYSTYQPLQEIAKNIIKMQTEEIEDMKEIAKTSYGFQNMPQEVNYYLEKYFEITKEMIERMKNAPRSMYINLNFTYEMILHHEGAIAMCENLLDYRIEPRLKKMAEYMIQEQTQEIQKIRKIQEILSGR